MSNQFQFTFTAKTPKPAKTMEKEVIPENCGNLDLFLVEIIITFTKEQVLLSFSFNK